MPNERENPSENPYEASSARGEAASPPEPRSLATSVVLGVAVFMASGVAFCGTCTVGTVVGMRFSPAVNEHVMRHGLMTGGTTGIICSPVVGVLLSRWLFKHFG